MARPAHDDRREYTATVGVPRAARDAGLRSYMLSVYNYMASGVLLTGIVALLFARCSSAAGQARVGRGMSGLGWLIDACAARLRVAMSFGINRISPGTLQIAVLGLRALMGLSLSTIFLVYTAARSR